MGGGALAMNARGVILGGSIPEPNSGCWLWLRSLNSWGYGRLAAGEATQRAAHRAAYEAFRGAIPPGKNVLHRCDTPSCVNPDHLWIGTNDDNMKDMAAKGRTGISRGEENVMAKLSESKVADIRGRTKFYGCMSQWSREFGVSRRAIAFALRGATWR